MRYLPKILGAALLLSAGLLVGSGPAAATMPGLLDRSAVTDSALEKVGYYYRRRHYGYRPYTYGYRLTGPITAMATDGPTMDTDMGVAGATKRAQPGTSIFSSRVQ